MSRKSDGAVFITEKAGSDYTLIDPLTGETVGEESLGRDREDQGQQQAAPRDPRRARRPDPDEPRCRDARAPPPRRSSRAATRTAIELIDTALEQETDPAIAKLMREARAAAVLNSDASDEEKLAAIEVLQERGGRDSLSLLTPLLTIEGPVGEAAHDAVSTIEERPRAVGRRCRTSGTASRSARCCCSPPSASPSPSA